MSRLTLTRDGSAFIRQAERTRTSGANPSFLHIKRAKDGSNTEQTVINFGLPAIVLDSKTQVQSATLTVTPAATWAGPVILTVSLIAGSWAASTASWATLDFAAFEQSVQAGDTNHAGGVPFSIDVTPLINAIRGGGRFYGFRIASTSQTLNSIRNNAAIPSLTIDYERAPERPSAASPVDGQVVDDPTPTLRMTQVDPTLTTINAIQVQTSKDAGATVDWDSGTVLTTETQLDLGKTAFAPMTAQGEKRWWRGRIRGNGDRWSEYTGWNAFSFETLGQVSIFNPPAPPNAVVHDQRSPLEWNTNGFQQEFFRAILSNNATKERLWDSGWIASREKSVYPPAGLITVVGQEYKWELWSTDGLERSIVGNNEAYAGMTRTFRYELANDVEPVYGLTAIDMDPLPFVKLRWSRDSLADQYEIVRDGRARALVDVEELRQPDGYFEWVDPSASPRRTHTWSVRAVVGRRTSASNPTVSKTIEPAGVWLCDLANGEYVTIITDKQQSMALTEDGGTFTPLNARYSVRVTTSLHGYSGSVVGEILKTELTGNETGQSMHDRFLRLRERKATEMSLILADAAYRIVPFNMTIAESPIPGRNGDYVYPCSFDFVQVGA
jgi:hypothetical protein